MSEDQINTLYEVIEDRIIPERIFLPNKEYIIDRKFKEGDVVILDGSVNDIQEPICKYTFTRNPSEGKKFIVRMQLTVEEVKDKLIRIE